MFPWFRIGSELVYTYPLILGIIWGSSYHLLKYLIELKQKEFKQFPIFFIGSFLSAWVGAKILFLMTIDADTASKAIAHENFWLGGGFVFYGGLIFGGLFVLLWGKLKNIKLENFEFLFPVLSFGHGVGRIGCFLAGCCYGTHCDLPWAVNMHKNMRHPVQLYEAVLLFILSFILVKRYKQNQTLMDIYIIAYGIIRFTLELFRGDRIRGVFAFGLSTSQTISIVLVLGTIIFFFKRKTISNDDST